MASTFASSTVVPEEILLHKSPLDSWWEAISRHREKRNVLDLHFLSTALQSLLELSTMGAIATLRIPYGENWRVTVGASNSQSGERRGHQSPKKYALGENVGSESSQTTSTLSVPFPGLLYCMDTGNLQNPASSFKPGEPTGRRQTSAFKVMPAELLLVWETKEELQPRKTGQEVRTSEWQE